MTKIWKSISNRGEERIRGGCYFHYALLEKSLNTFCAASSSRVVFALNTCTFRHNPFPSLFLNMILKNWASIVLIKFLKSSFFLFNHVPLSLIYVPTNIGPVGFLDNTISFPCSHQPGNRYITLY